MKLDFSISNEDTLDTLSQKLKEIALEAFMELKVGQYTLEIKKPLRTNPQNNALHKYYELVAEALCDAGINKMDVLILMKTSMPWSPESVKEDIWKNFQKYKGFGDKTSKLKTDQVNKVYDLCNLFLSERVGIDHIPFPSKESLNDK